MTEKIERALQIFKAISEAINSEQCRGRIVTFEDVNEKPFAEVFVVYDGTAIQRIEIEDNGRLFGKKVDSEEQAINDVTNIVKELQKVGEINCIWLGD